MTREPEECPTCSARPEITKVRGEYRGQYRVGAALVEVAYLCPNGHLWSERFQRGDKRIPNLTTARDRTATGTVPPQPAPAPKRCAVVGCHYRVARPGHGRCFVHHEGG